MDDYKKYSLGQLENFLYDAMSTDATPQEIYDVLKGVVEDNYKVYSESANKSLDLLNLLNGYRATNLDLNDDDFDPITGIGSNYFNNSKKAKLDIPERQQYTEEELDAMCIAAEAKDKVKKWILPVEEAESGDTGEQEYFITFPDDLLEAANLKEGDQIEWVEQSNGSYIIQKPSWVKGNEIAKVKTYQEMIDDGWEMTDDGFWIKEN
jgi:bifunctional DNA-binding transcriptional regulator/antitoxin component of YhaV-PrlF toxin-antitoxin module